MIIVDPTVTNTDQNNARAPAINTLKGKTIGVLSNRKLNADLLLQETALCLVSRHGGKVLPMAHKLNPECAVPRQYADGFVPSMRLSFDGNR